MIIQIVLILFIIFVLLRIFLRYRTRDITGREFVLWLVFWSLAAIAIVIPKQTDVIASWVGVERGADLLLYISVVTLFFIIFKILVRLEKIEHNITELVRAIAIKNTEKRDD